jgi:hypothetical protein
VCPCRCRLSQARPFEPKYPNAKIAVIFPFTLKILPRCRLSSSPRRKSRQLEEGHRWIPILPTQPLRSIASPHRKMSILHDNELTRPYPPPIYLCANVLSVSVVEDERSSAPGRLTTSSDVSDVSRQIIPANSPIVLNPLLFPQA